MSTTETAEARQRDRADVAARGARDLRQGLKLLDGTTSPTLRVRYRTAVRRAAVAVARYTDNGSDLELARMAVRHLAEDHEAQAVARIVERLERHGADLGDAAGAVIDELATERGDREIAELDRVRREAANR